jgi:sugar diacid utilization regulator
MIFQITGGWPPGMSGTSCTRRLPVEIETDELQGIVDGLAARLGRSVAIDDPSIRLLAASRHFGDEDPVRIRVMLNRQADGALVEYAQSCGISRSEIPVRVPGRPELGLRPRVCVPIRWSRLLLGFLWLIEPDASLGQEEISQAVTAAEAAGMVLYRRMLLHEHERGRQEALLRDLVSADPAARARAQDEIADSGPMAATGHVALASVDIVSPSEGSVPTDAQAALSAAVEEACRAEPAGRTLVQAQPRRALLLYAAPCSPEAVQERLAALAHRVLRVLSSSSNGVFRAVAGVGSVQASLDHCPVSYRHARTAAKVASLLQGFGPVATWDSLGVYALLLQLPQRDLVTDLCPPALLRLVTTDRSGRLLETAETYLDCAGDATRAAEALHIHRTTLHYRLGRIQALSGFDLANGNDRLTLHLGANRERPGRRPRRWRRTLRPKCRRKRTAASRRTGWSTHSTSAAG